MPLQEVPRTASSALWSARGKDRPFQQASTGFATWAIKNRLVSTQIVRRKCRGKKETTKQHGTRTTRLTDWPKIAETAVMHGLRFPDPEG